MAENKNWQVYMRTLSDSAKYLFNNKEMSDVTFIFKTADLENKRIYAHSWILSMMSPIFYSSFKENFEVRKEIPITDKSYSVFLELLRFLYTAKCDLNGENVFDIMELAKKYSLKFLGEDCAYFIENNLTEDIACMVLTKRITITNESLKTKAIQYIGPRMSYALKTDAFFDIDKDCLESILTFDDIGTATEIEVFYGVMQWAAQRCRFNKVEENAERKREYLGDLLKLIRFPTMTAEEFGECISREQGLLTTEEEISLLMSIATKQKNKIGFVDAKRKSVDLTGVPDIHLCIGKLVYFFMGHTKYEISKRNSIFRTNRTFYLTHITVGQSYRSENTVTISLKNNKFEILSKEKFKIGNNRGYSENLALARPMLLQPNREYMLTLLYQNKDSEVFCTDVKNHNCSIQQSNIQIDFTEVSPFLFTFTCKNFDK